MEKGAKAISATAERSIIRAHYLLSVAPLFLAACQPPPPPAPTASHIQKPVPDVADVTYVARNMLPKDQRSAAAIYGSLSSSSATVSPTGAAAGGVAAAAASGQSPLSSAGSATVTYVSLGFSAAGAVVDSLGGGGYSTISEVNLPPEIDGQALSSAEDARRFIREESRRNLEDFAHRTGHTMSCISECYGNFPTYEVRKAGGANYPYYDPPVIYVTIYIRPLADLSRVVNPVRDKALGFEPRWGSKDGNGYAICLNDQPPAGGTKAEAGETVPDLRCTAPYIHPLSRELLRALTTSGHTFFGSGNFFAWHGRVFALGKRTAAELIKYEIAAETDHPVSQ